MFSVIPNSAFAKINRCLKAVVRDIESLNDDVFIHDMSLRKLQYHIDEIDLLSCQRLSRRCNPTWLVIKSNCIKKAVY